MGVVALAVATATAQTPQPSSETSLCPRDALTIYYANGQATPSDHGRQLIARIGEEAAQCRPDAIDLVTGIDTEREGAQALALAMARLNGVADAIVAEGFPADRIRVAAQGKGEELAPMGEITVLFRHTPLKAGDAVAPAQPAGPPPTRDAI